MEDSTAPREPTSATFAYRCALCGVSSDNPDAYETMYRGRSRGRTLCRPCEQLEAMRLEPRMRRLVFLGGVLAIAVGAFFPESIAARIGWAFVNFVVVPVLLAFPTILFHELAHWGAARALGLRVHDVQIGSGPDRWVGHLGEVRIRWKRHALLGLVRFSAPSRRWVRLRAFLVTAAGPASHLVAIGLAYTIATQLGLLGEGLLGVGSAIASPNPLVGLVFINLGQLIVNLIPQRIGSMSTDGATLLALPFYDAETIDALVESQWIHPAEMALGEGDWDRAESVIRAWLERDPDSLGANLFWAAYLGAKGQPERATLALRALHAREALDPTQRAYIAGNLAWCLTLIDDLADRSERDALIGEAERVLGEQPSLLSTRGAALLADGRPSEAWSLLADALAKLDERDHRATVLCNLARAEHALGLSDQARDRLEEALRLSPGNALLDRTERELARDPQASTQPRPKSLATPRTLELPIDGYADRRPRRRWIPRWAWVGVPALFFLGSCGPPYLEAMLTIDVPYHDLARGPATEAEQRACQTGLAKLERWDWLLARLPGYQEIAGVDWRITRIAQLEACTGDPVRAREILVGATDAQMARLGPLEAKIGYPADAEADWEDYSVAMAAFNHHLLLTHLQNRMGREEEATATLDRAEPLARYLDEAWSAEPLFASRSRIAVLRSSLFESRNGAEEALVELEEFLETISPAIPDLRLLPLLERRASLLEQLGREEEAARVWARIGRANRDAYAMARS